MSGFAPAATIDRVEPPAQNDAGAELDRLVREITRHEAVVAGWDTTHAAVAKAMAAAIEALNKEAFRRLIRALKDTAALPELRAAVTDPVVHGVLAFHGLLREPLETRLERALDEVRPAMRGHGGDVELVRIDPPDAVEIRLIGACHGCPASGETLREGVERSIRTHCPEIVHVRQVSRGPAKPAGNAPQFISPFAADMEAGWVDVSRLEDVPEGGILEHRIAGRSVLLSRRNGHVSCFDNACAHLGMPLEMGEVADGIFTCSYHGFRYLLETGECLTAPEVQLVMHAVRVRADRIAVRLEA